MVCGVCVCGVCVCGVCGVCVCGDVFHASCLFRSCGGVFCSSCSSHFVPVESQLLVDPVRVCDGCFDKMDGHLAQSQEEGLEHGPE